MTLWVVIFCVSVQGGQSICGTLIDSFSCIASRQYSEMKHVCLLEQLHCRSSVFDIDVLDGNLPYCCDT